jgi:hypothetical protein
LPENRRKAMASDLQVAIARFVQDNYADSNAFGDLISPRAPSVVSSRIMQARSLLNAGFEANSHILTIASKDVEELLSQGHFYALGPIHYARKVVNHFQ